MTLPILPNQRLSNSSIAGKPAFVSDVINSNAQTFTLLGALLDGISFAIISGFDIVEEEPGNHHFTTGIVFLNGVFYLYTPDRKSVV